MFGPRACDQECALLSQRHWSQGTGTTTNSSNTSSQKLCIPHFQPSSLLPYFLVKWMMIKLGDIPELNIPGIARHLKVTVGSSSKKPLDNAGFALDPLRSSGSPMGIGLALMVGFGWGASAPISQVVNFVLTQSFHECQLPDFLLTRGSLSAESSSLLSNITHKFMRFSWQAMASDLKGRHHGSY